jgi:hypothetical protein
VRRRDLARDLRTPFVKAPRLKFGAGASVGSNP